MLQSLKTRKWLGDGATYAILTVGACAILLPFAWMISTSLKEPSQVFIFPPRWIPKPVVWRNYIDALTALPFTRFFQNTLTILFLCLVGELLSCSLVAFSFARTRWRGRDVCFVLLLSTMMLPRQVTIIPLFVLFRQLNWIDTFLPLVIPAWFATNAFYVFLLRQFYMTIPLELDDAARIDGCTLWGIYWRIIVPLSKPVLIAISVFSFQTHWNEFFLPLIYLNSTSKFTIALGLQSFKGMYETEWTLLMAASFTCMIPLLVIFYVAQKHFVQGVVITGVKG